MCANYVPVTQAGRLLTFFGVEHERDEKPHDVFPTGLAPIIRLDPKHRHHLIADEGIFGLLPHFATEIAYGRRTYNARAETAHEKPSFKHAWAANQRCVIPAEAIYEPNYETGKAVRWRIGLPGDVPMGIAGIYRVWRHPADGREMLSFAMLTVNADDHAVMKRFHKPGDEKRMVVILRPEEYLPWLTCDLNVAPSYFKQYHGELVTAPSPLLRPPRSHGQVMQPPRPPSEAADDLFGPQG
jgi:putative SOS response-associated peptidase YedK